MSEIIRYEHVDISYKGELAVHDVSFSVEEGEILGIVGESGSGKSTLIKAAMGLLGRDGLVTRGDIWYQGLDLPDLKPKKMRKICGSEIGMIFQMAGSSFCPIRTVRAQLYESVREHEKLTKEEFEVQILMADEPTSALDVSVQKQVVDETCMVREKFGTTILLVTHNLGVIRAMADKVLVLENGEVREYGKTKEVLENPQSEYTKKLLSAVLELRR